MLQTFTRSTSCFNAASGMDSHVLMGLAASLHIAIPLARLTRRQTGPITPAVVSQLISIPASKKPELRWSPVGVIQMKNLRRDNCWIIKSLEVGTGSSSGLRPQQAMPLVRQPVRMQAVKMLHLLQCAVPRIYMCGTEHDMDKSSDEMFMSVVKGFLLDPAQFVAGNVRHHLPAWQKFFAVFGTTSKAAAVLQWIEHGVSFDFAHPFSEVQKSHPRYNERLQLVQGLLSLVSAGSVNAMLDRDTPGSIC